MWLRIKMGPDEYDGTDNANPLSKNSVFSKIEPNILRILHKFGSTPESEIVETLVNDIDEHELDVCRQMFFEESKLVVTKNTGENTIPSFEMKVRKNPGKNISYAKDVVKLGLYLCELKSEYPIDLLKNSGTYVPLTFRDRSKSVNDVNNAIGSSTSLGTKNEGLGQGIQGSNKCESNKKCDDCSAHEAKIVSLNEMYHNEIETMKSNFDMQIVLLKSELSEFKLEFAGRLRKVEQATETQPRTKNNKQASTTEHKKQSIPEPGDGEKSPASCPPGSFGSVEVVDSRSSTASPLRTQTRKERYEMPEPLSDSQLRNLTISQLLDRANTIGQANDSQENTANESDSESAKENDTSCSEDDNESDVESTDEYETDDENDDVFVTHVDVGTSPKMVRMVFTGSAEEKKEPVTEAVTEHTKGKTTNEWKTQHRRKATQRKNSSASQTSEGRMPRKNGFKGKAGRGMSSETDKKKTESSSRTEKQTQKKSKSHLFEGKPHVEHTEHRGKSCTLFLQNITKKDCHPKELADSIKEYGSKKGYQIKFARIYENNNKNVVSCKIVVPESQSEELIGESSRVWPKNVTCRRWRESGPPSENDTPSPNYRKFSEPRKNYPQKSTYDWAGRKFSRGKLTRSVSSSSDWESENEGDKGMRTWYRKFIKYCYENESKK